MALETEVNFKAAIATAAADLTTALQDTVLTELAAEVKNPSHPLRNIENLFLLDPVTGVYAANDDFIAAAYAGAMPSIGTNLNGVGPRLLALVSATVEDAAPADIVLTFDKNITRTDALAIGGEAKVVSGVVVAGAVVTITVTVAYALGNVITASGLFSGPSLELLELEAQSVTNNVT